MNLKAEILKLYDSTVDNTKNKISTISKALNITPTTVINHLIDAGLYKEDIKDLLNKGYTYIEISQRLNVLPNIVLRAIKKYTEDRKTKAEKLQYDVTAKIMNLMNERNTSAEDINKKLKNQAVAKIIGGHKNISLKDLSDIAWALGVEVEVIFK